MKKCTFCAKSYKSYKRSGSRQDKVLPAAFRGCQRLRRRQHPLLTGANAGKLLQHSFTSAVPVNHHISHPASSSMDSTCTASGGAQAAAAAK